MANFKTNWIAVFIFGSTFASVILAKFLFVTKFASKYDDYAKLCAPTIKCDVNSKYRSINGSCNNLKMPWFGAFKTPHLRILNAFYNDGKYLFRKQKNGNPLPNARVIQLEVFLFKESQYWDDYNVLFMEWGQFIAHDISDLPPDVSIGPDCCALQDKKPVPYQCDAVIEVPNNDPVYSKFGQTCINFIRAETSFTDGCPLIPATFMVQSTHFIDGSQIYGSNKEVAESLRSFVNGRLKSDYLGGREEFCSQTNRTTCKCGTSKKSKICYAAGDSRVNQNLGIALFQNMFLRFHNIVAYNLYRLNPFWTDEIIYQETRKFVAAIIQHITYTFYLPILLGEKFMVLNGFFEQNVYDETVNPSTTQEFSTSAYRILHQQIPPGLNLIDENHYDIRRLILTDWMNKPDLLPLSNNFDELLRGFQETPSRAVQSSYNLQISNLLFKQDTPKFSGQDLLSIDIQRGRDTGLPPYNKMRLVCGIPEAESFDDLIDLISYENVQKLKSLYSSVDDIDLHVGALLEIPVKDAKLGPTSRCIISNSFYRYKTGDRFFYDVQGQPGSFTSGQLQTIKDMNFGHIICATSSLDNLPKDIFKPLYNRFNTQQYSSCDDFTLNLDEWKDNY